MTRNHPGRPKGSKNKPKDAAVTTLPAPTTSKKKISGAAEASSGPGPVVPPTTSGNVQQSTSDLEQQRIKLASELSAVEARIYHLETQYLENSSPFGNAIRGYEGFLGGAAAANRKVVVKAEDRLFSWSSVTGQVPAQR